MVVNTAPVVMLRLEEWRYMSHQNTRETLQKFLEAGLRHSTVFAGTLLHAATIAQASSVPGLLFMFLIL